jgi:hypothetical protein
MVCATLSTQRIGDMVEPVLSVRDLHVRFRTGDGILHVSLNVIWDGLRDALDPKDR